MLLLLIHPHCLNVGKRQGACSWCGWSERCSAVLEVWSTWLLSHSQPLRGPSGDSKVARPIETSKGCQRSTPLSSATTGSQVYWSFAESDRCRQNGLSSVFCRDMFPLNFFLLLFRLPHPQQYYTAEALENEDRLWLFLYSQQALEDRGIIELLLTSDNKDGLQKGMVHGGTSKEPVWGALLFIFFQAKLSFSGVGSCPVCITPAWEF